MKIYSAGPRGLLQSLRDFLGDFLGDFLRDFLGDFLTEGSDLAPRGSGNQNCGFQGVRLAAVTPFVV